MLSVLLVLAGILLVPTAWSLQLNAGDSVVLDYGPVYSGTGGEFVAIKDGQTLSYFLP